MRKITLRAAALRSFKSFYDAKVELSTQPGLKYLTGDNVVEPRLGANGAGKSSLLDAVFWCWYGTSVKGRRASELVTWGEKRPSVATVVDIDGAEYHIYRHGNPDDLTINGEASTQADVDALLRLNRSRARHAFVFGQNVPFFVDLSIPDRGALLDEVLDLQIYADAAKVAASAQAIHEDKAKNADIDIAEARGRLAGMDDPEALERQAEEWEEERKAARKENARKRRDLMAKMSDLSAEVAKLEKERDRYNLDELEAPKREIAEMKRDFAEHMRMVTQHTTKLERAREDLRHMENNPDCPTCGQKFPAAARKTEITALKDRIKKCLAAAAAAKEEADKTDQAVALKEASIEKHERLGRKAIVALSEVRAERRVVEGMLEQLNATTDDAENPFIARLEAMAAREVEAKKDLKRYKSVKRHHEEVAERSKYWRDGFRRVRLFRIKQVLQHLELEVEAAAAALGLAGWSIKFHTETETKSGSLKQGVQVTVKSPVAAGAWEDWSGGEGQRIRLAVARGFSRMVQRMAGVHFTFEFWDEPSAYLSDAGVADLVAALRSASQSDGVSLWLVDHGLANAGTFDEEWIAIKGAEGTEIWRL